MNHGTRTSTLPQGAGVPPREIEGNLCFALALWLIWLCLRHGVFFTLEHPRGSRGWLLALVLLILTLPGVFKVGYDPCAWGLRPSDWSPLDGDVRTYGPGIVVTNLPTMEVLRRRCVDADKHKHEVAIGSSASGSPRTKDKAVFPTMWCQAYARAVRTAWLNDLSA